MKTYPIKTNDGRLLAFEIPNWRLSRSGACVVVERIPGVVLVRRPKIMSWFRESAFCEFKVEGELYEIEEPFGDNSRYWVGPKPPRVLPQTEAVHAAFSRW